MEKQKLLQQLDIDMGINPDKNAHEQFMDDKREDVEFPECAIQESAPDCMDCYCFGCRNIERCGFCSMCKNKYYILTECTQHKY